MLRMFLATTSETRNYNIKVRTRRLMISMTLLGQMFGIKMSKERKILVMTRYFILQKNDHNNLKYMAEKDYVLLPSSLVYTFGNISKEI